MFSRMAVLLAILSLVLVGGIYSHGPEANSHTASKLESGPQHAHLEVREYKELVSDVLHCGADNVQFSQYNSVSLRTNLFQPVCSNPHMGSNLWTGVEPPPPKFYL